MCTAVGEAVVGFRSGSGGAVTGVETASDSRYRRLQTSPSCHSDTTAPNCLEAVKLRQEE